MAAPDTIVTYRDRVKSILEISTLPTGIAPSDPDVDVVVERALEDYGTDRAYVRVFQVVGDDTARKWNLDTFTGYAVGWSRIVSPGLRIRLAADANDLGRIVAPGSYEVRIEVQSGVQKEVLILNAAPASTELLEVHYIAPHVLDSTAANHTVPLGHRGALSYLAASHGALWIAQRAVDSRDANVLADAVDFTSISEKYRTMAGEWRDLYERQVLGKDRSNIAGGFVQVERPASVEARLSTHGPAVG